MTRTSNARNQQTRMNAGNTAQHNGQKRPSKAEKRVARQEAKVEEQAPRVHPVQGKTPGQRHYLAAMKANDMTIVVGPAGTGKSFLAANLAAQMFAAGQIDEIILSRPAVAGGDEEHGFLPGDINKKLAPWAKPIVALLEKRLGPAKVQQMIFAFQLRIEPFTYMRGLTFENAFIILDEAQNATVEQMKLFTTRMGENVKIVIDGDISDMQNDLERKGVRSGLKAVWQIVRNREMPSVASIELTIDDIVRGPQTKMWVKAWQDFETPVVIPPLDQMDDKTIATCRAKFEKAYFGHPRGLSHGIADVAFMQPVAKPVDGAGEHM